MWKSQPAAHRVWAPHLTWHSAVQPVCADLHAGLAEMYTNYVLTGVCTCPTSHQLGFMDTQELLEVGCQIMYDLLCSLLFCAINKLCKGLCLTFLIFIDVFPSFFRSAIIMYI